MVIIKRKYFLLLFCIFILTSFVLPAAYGQGLSLLGEDVEEGAETDSEPVVVSTSDEGTQEVKEESEYDKLNNSEVVQKTRNGEKLTREEFILYLETIEALNPLMSWEQIITKMHSLQYPQDTDLKVAGIRLFQNGEENEGWEKVYIPGNNPPKFVVDDNGKVIDIAHAYAGLRAGLNRGAITGWSMGNVNTGWVDSLQVASDKIEATQSYICGAFTFDYDKTDKAIDKFSNAHKFKPDDQVRGNELGLELKSYLEDHPNRSLSSAFRSVWAQQDCELQVKELNRAKAANRTPTTYSYSQLKLGGL